MTDEMYEAVKTVFAENERLFTKLLKVALEYDTIEFDESGFYEEDAARCERHWNKLASRLAEALRDGVKGVGVEVLRNPEPNVRVIRFDITTHDDEETGTTRLSVDYAVDGELSITRGS